MFFHVNTVCRVCDEHWYLGVCQTKHILIIHISILLWFSKNALQFVLPWIASKQTTHFFLFSLRMSNTLPWIRILGALQPNDSTYLDRIAMADSFDTQGPTFIIEPQQHLEFTNIVDNHVDCTARGSPPPKIEWLMLDNSPVTTIPRVSIRISNEISTSMPLFTVFCSFYSVEIVLVVAFFSLRMIIIVCTEFFNFFPYIGTPLYLARDYGYFYKIYACRVQWGVDEMRTVKLDALRYNL